MKKALLLLSALLMLGTGSSAFAWELDFPGAATMTGSDFRELSKELGGALAYRNLAPAAPLGITGFDVALQTSAINICNESSYWQAAGGDDVPSILLLPTVRVKKGLPFSIDIGAMYSQVPDSEIKLYGAEVGMALLDGTLATPALGLRATYTRLEGVEELDLQTAGVDAALSKGFLFLTPYIGGGMLWVDSQAKGAIAALGSDTSWQPRGFAGLKISPLPLLSITAEVEYASQTIYSLKAGLSF